MQPYQEAFVEFLIQQKALLFGNFTLKSGRISPYFFNAGQFNTAAAIATLGKFYAKAIFEANLQFDILFGPAYKGIPIVTSTAIALFEEFGVDKPFCFNRKEVKNHGEGGYLVGAPLKGRVLLVDDVISSGQTLKESVELIAIYPTTLTGVITALDREERGDSPLSAVDEIKNRHHIEFINILKLHHVIEFMRRKGTFTTELAAILTYQKKYGQDPS